MAFTLFNKSSIKGKIFFRFFLLFLIFFAQVIVAANSVNQIENNSSITHIQSATKDTLGTLKYYYARENNLLKTWASGLGSYSNVSYNIDEYNDIESTFVDFNYNFLASLLIESEKLDKSDQIDFEFAYSLYDNITTNLRNELGNFINNNVFKIPSYIILSDLDRVFVEIQSETNALYGSLLKYYMLRNTTYYDEFWAHSGSIQVAIQQLQFSIDPIKFISKSIYDSLQLSYNELFSLANNFKSNGNLLFSIISPDSNATELSNGQLNQINSFLNLMETDNNGIINILEDLKLDNKILISTLKKNSFVASEKINNIIDQLDLFIAWASNSQLYLLNQTRQIVSNQQVILFTMGMIGLIIVLFITYDIINKIINPIESVAGWSNLIAEGDLTKTQRQSQREDEVGTLVNNFRAMNRNLREIITEVHDTNALIVLTAEELSSNSEEVNATAEEVSAIAQSMATGSTQQAEIINIIVEELQNADEVVNRVINQITQNLLIVKDLSEQTNVLALNTAIEAANAGDFGKGFTVIAENIRKMSDQSSKTAKQVTQDSKAVLTQLQSSFSLITEKIENVAAVSEETAASAEEVAASAMEMTANMETIAAKSTMLNDQSVQSMMTVNKFAISREDLSFKGDFATITDTKIN